MPIKIKIASILGYRAKVSGPLIGLPIDILVLGSLPDLFFPISPKTVEKHDHFRKEKIN
jgi:hypothetical protein